MFSFIKNFLRAPSSTAILEEFYQHADLYKTQWVSIAINKTQIAESMLTKEVELLTPTDAFSLKISDKKIVLQHQLWKNNVSLSKAKVPTDAPLNLHYNHLIDHIFEKEIQHFQKELNLSVPEIIQPELAADDKALEWIKVSFKILENAIIESLINSDYLFQTLAFLGKNPKTSLNEMRIIIFNLDILYRILPNGNLRVQIYNDKALDFGSSKKAALEGDFKFRKREMLDELTKLISVLAPGIKLKC